MTETSDAYELAGRGAEPVSEVALSSTALPAGTPFVSVVIPCFNEEKFIHRVLETLSQQYDNEHCEIIVVDGMSVDGTRAEIARFINANPQVSVRLVDNPLKHIPAALNLGISSARGDIIVRMDAHSVPSENYVRTCVAGLRSGENAVIGMPWNIQPATDTATARAIALAVGHPFGIGDAKYRLHSEGQQAVDTVPFGAFRRELWSQLGGFNEELLTNEDYEFNYRVRSAGGRVLLDGTAHAVYYARSSFKELARQYFRYGMWKAQMLKLHPQSIRLRHVVAPAFVASLLVLLILARWEIYAAWALLAIVGSYLLLALFSALQLCRRSRDYRLLVHIAIAFLVIHICWGTGFWGGIFRSLPRSSAGPRASKSSR